MDLNIGITINIDKPMRDMLESSEVDVDDVVGVVVVEVNVVDEVEVSLVILEVGGSVSLIAVNHKSAVN